MPFVGFCGVIDLEEFMSRGKKIRIVIGIIFLFLSAGVGFGVAKVKVSFNESLNHVKRDYNSKLSTVDLKGIKVESDDDIVNILIIGNDGRSEKGYVNERGLSDAILIGTMDRKHGTLKLTSVMRDLRVYVPAANDYMKINAATDYEGGVKSLYETLANSFNIKLDGYVKISLDAFRHVIDELGGVEVEITDTEARYLRVTNYIRKKKNRQKIKVGKQVLNGDQALGYCRIRKGMDIIHEPVVTVSGLTDDYGRTWRQRTVISSAFSKLKTMPVSKWYDMANAVLGDITTDLDNDAIIDYIKAVATMGTTQIHQLQIPQNPYFRESQKGEFKDSCLVPTNGISSENDPSKNAAVLQQFIFEYDGEGDFKYQDSTDSSTQTETGSTPASE